MKRTTIFFLLIILSQIVICQNKPIDTLTLGQEMFIEYEQGASFPGGHIALFSFLDNNLNKNIVSQKSLPERKVFIRFTIDTLGKVSNVKILKIDSIKIESNISGGTLHSNNCEVDNEIIRVIKLMPNWIPYEIYIGYPNGKWVKKRNRIYFANKNSL